MESEGKDIREGTFCFPKDDPIYREHFPGNPIVPGSLVIQAFLRAAQIDDAGAGGLGVKNFKFRHFLVPDRKYAYHLRFEPGKIYCRLTDEKFRIMVEGVLET